MMKYALIVFVIVGFLVGGMKVYYTKAINTPLSVSEEMVSVTIKTGQRVNSIADLLMREGVIRSALMFKVYLRLNGLENRIQAGEYDISRDLNIKEVVEILSHGTFDIRLTIIEGWRVEEIADYIGTFKGLSFSGVDFLEIAKDYEGKIFPDTYIVPMYISAMDLVDLMRSTFNQKFSSRMREDLEKSGLSLDEAVIFASIVERESKLFEDRSKVAGILLRRLKNNWPLEADASVQYVLGYQTEIDPKSGEYISSWWKRNLYESDLKVDSPYNTRKNAGLPPSPICNPGFDSLKAVVYFEESEFWYYVSDEEGKMHYAKTLDEHNENVRKYINNY